MKQLLCILTVLLLTAPAAAQTLVTEDIVAPESWTPAGSPYIIQNDIKVWAALTIQSSASQPVTVEFDGFYSMTTDGLGFIVAEGSADHDVLFTSLALPHAPGDWNCVSVSMNQSSFSRCTFEYANIGVRANGADAAISYCTFRFCWGPAIWCFNGSPTVLHCDIHDNDVGLQIHCSGYQSHPVINHSNIYDNSTSNLNVVAYPEPLVVLDAQNNWWGTNIEAEIQAMIHDSADNPAVYATVDYDPWLHEVPVEEMTWGRVKALFAE